MNEIARGWVKFAKADIDGAEFLLKESRFTSLVTFHSHQAVEKILKAVLAEHTLRIPKIHSLFKLLEIIRKNGLLIDIVPKIDLNELIALDEILIESRYPGDMGLLPGGIPTLGEAEAIFVIARKIFDLMIGELS